ncbi:hypothetical protein [Bradyrhizobium sp.]|uniref:hypothetical protein n=1 Tax=Bradyrhizobium sp. TaxID=376 RepID=UPI002E0854E0|nr:hypothetical protein [Bradyrhizobium sp.]
MTQQALSKLVGVAQGFISESKTDQRPAMYKLSPPQRERWRYRWTIWPHPSRPGCQIQNQNAAINVGRSGRLKSRSVRKSAKSRSASANG